MSDATQPALCQWSDFGDIDPRTFVDGDQEYLLWKSDDNAGEDPPTSTFQPTKLWSQKLAPDGTTLEGSPTELLVRNKSWEVPLVEAPDMIKRGGRYYLFFSGSASWFPQGGIGVAFCKSPSGPCRDVYKGPWLGSSLLGSGPDEETLFEQNGATWLLYAPQAVYHPLSYPVLGVSRVAMPVRSSLRGGVRRNRAQPVSGRHRRPGRSKVWLAVLVASAVVGGLADFALFNGTHASAQTDLPPAPNTDLGIVYTPDQSFAQPDVMPTDTVDYLYSSGTGTTPNVPSVTFTAIGAWSEVHDAMPTLPLLGGTGNADHVP